MAHRTVVIDWLPRSKVAWATFTTARKAAATLWNDMVVRHARIRRLNWKWPSLSRWMQWAKGRCVGLSSQSVQQCVMDFVDAIFAAAKARKAQRDAGEEMTRQYPWHSVKYRCVTYTNQSATIRNGWLRLPNGKGQGVLRVRIPRGMKLPGRVMEVTLSFGSVRIACESPSIESSGSVVGVDLGINSVITASDGISAVVVSGRALKSFQQYHNKRLASFDARQSKHKKGSRRHKRLQRRKRKHCGKCSRKQNDLLHKATRAIADIFPGASVFVGKAFQDAAQYARAPQAQQISEACTGKITRQLKYKFHKATVVSEAYSSQTCPACGCLQKCKRVYRCKACGLTAPRDVVGAVNIRAIGLYGKLMPEQPMPTVVRFVRPLRKYPRPSQGALGSSGGTPASRSEAA